jgi:hypothetical protein
VIAVVITTLRTIWYSNSDPITGGVERISKRPIKEDELPPEIKKKLGL